jgi:Uma2 family endonuclease
VATLTTPKPLTASEYERLPEVDGFRDELIEGERVLSPLPKAAHALVIERLAEILKGQLPKLHSEPLMVLRETGWRFRSEAGLESVPGPDLMVVLAADVRNAVRNKSWFEGTPLFAIEVISPSERKSRRLQKVGLYLEMGTRAVVEVDYTRRIVRMYFGEDESVAEYGPGERFAAPFEAAVDDIFSVIVDL